MKQNFKINGFPYKVPVCLSCHNSAEEEPEEQTHETLASIVCIHCKISSNIIRNYEDCWTLDGALHLEQDDEEETVVEIFHRWCLFSFSTSCFSDKKHHFFIQLGDNALPVVAFILLLNVNKYNCGREN